MLKKSFSVYFRNFRTFAKTNSHRLYENEFLSRIWSDKFFFQKRHFHRKKDKKIRKFKKKKILVQKRETQVVFIESKIEEEIIIIRNKTLFISYC